MLVLMLAAIVEAQLGLKEVGFRFGSVIVHEVNIIGRGQNRRVQE
ncbi:nucleoside deaminase, partial [Pseudomonas syringae pv. tagetis]